MMHHRDLSPPRAPTMPTVLGIVGTRADITGPDVAADLLSLIVDDIGRPTHILLPSEGDSSIHIETWAIKQDIEVACLEADWRRQGRRAKAVRDAQIVTQATHFLIFGGPRSTKPLELAKTLTHKGKKVYYLPYKSWELEEFAPLEKAPKNAETGHKQDKGKGNLRQLTLTQVFP
jgi:hypothetical protein